MKKLCGFSLFLFFQFSFLLGITGEYKFHIIGIPATGYTGAITIIAQSEGTVYDCTMEPTDDYHYATGSIDSATWMPGDSPTISFDWFNDPSGNDTLAYGLYRISAYPGSAFFYFDLRDCYYSSCRIQMPEGMAWSPGLDMHFYYDLEDMEFLDFGTGQNINETTVGIWKNRSPSQPYTDCFTNPRLELANVNHDRPYRFGRLILDESIYIDTDNKILLPAGTWHTARSENTIENTWNGIIGQHHWDNYDGNIDYLRNFYIQNNYDYSESVFKEVVKCNINISYIYGGEPDIKVKFLDPWLIENGYDRPGIAHEFTELINHTVFQNENQFFYPYHPIYKIIEPIYKVEGDLIAFFNNWIINPPDGAVLSSSGPETDVVFVTDGVTISAEYYNWYRSAFQGNIPIDIALNGTIHVVGDITIQSGANVTVQSGTIFLMDEDTKINV